MPGSGLALDLWGTIGKMIQVSVVFVSSSVQRILTK